MTAVDETTMREEDLEEAVGLLTQLEVGTPPNLRPQAMMHPAPPPWPELLLTWWPSLCIPSCASKLTVML